MFIFTENLQYANCISVKCSVNWVRLNGLNPSLLSPDVSSKVDKRSESLGLFSHASKQFCGLRFIHVGLMQISGLHKKSKASLVKYREFLMSNNSFLRLFGVYHLQQDE